MRRTPLLVCLVLSGCAGVLARSAGPVTSVAVQSLDDPPNREALGQVLGSPEVTEGARVLAAEVGQGLAQGLSDDDVVRDVRQLSRLVAAEAARTLLKVFREEVAPQASRQLRAELEGSLQPLIREVAREATFGALAAVEEKAAQKPDESLFGRLKALTAGAWVLLFLGLMLLVLMTVWVVRFVRRTTRSRGEPAATDDLEPQVEAALRRLLRDPEWRTTMRQTLDEERPGAPH